MGDSVYNTLLENQIYTKCFSTGFFVCQCCKYNGPWNLYERFLNCKSDKSPSAMRELLKEMESKECFRSKNLTEKTKLFSKLSQKQVTTVLEKLDMPVSNIKIIFWKANYYTVNLIIFPICLMFFLS